MDAIIPSLQPADVAEQLRQKQVPYIFEFLIGRLLNDRPHDSISYLLEKSLQLAHPRSVRSIARLVDELVSAAVPKSTSEPQVLVITGTRIISILQDMCSCVEDVKEVWNKPYIWNSFELLMRTQLGIESPGRAYYSSVTLIKLQTAFVNVISRIYLHASGKKSLGDSATAVQLDALLPPLVLMIRGTMGQRLRAAWAVLVSMQQGSPLARPSVDLLRDKSMDESGEIPTQLRTLPAQSIVRKDFGGGDSATVKQYVAFLVLSTKVLCVLRGLPGTQRRMEAVKNVSERAFHGADRNENGTLELPEFMEAIESPDHPIYAILNDIVNGYSDPGETYRTPAIGRDPV